jgi:hypothetical protein
VIGREYKPASRRVPGFVAWANEQGSITKEHLMDTIVNLALSDIELQIIQMALAEYMAVRGGEYAGKREVQEYIDRRYKLSDGYSEKFRASKHGEVTTRLATTKALRNRTFEVYADLRS